MNSSHCPPKQMRSKEKKKKRNANMKRNLQIQTAPKTPNIFRAKLNFILDIKYYINLYIYIYIYLYKIVQYYIIFGIRLL